MHVDDVDVDAVESVSTSLADNLRGRPARGPPVGDVDDAIHHRQQRVHVVRGDQHRDLLFRRDSRQQIDDLLLAGDVEVRQRLVQEQQPRAADQRVGDQDPLLLTAGELADTRVRESLGVDRVEHLVDLASGATRDGQREAEPLPVDAEPDQVPGAQRHVRVQRDPLRHVADQRSPRPPSTRTVRRSAP